MMGYILEVLQHLLCKVKSTYLDSSHIYIYLNFYQYHGLNLYGHLTSIELYQNYLSLYGLDFFLNQ